MRFSLPLRIFLVHLAFSVGAASLAVFLVRDSFDRYKERWDREVETLAGETLFQPLANEIARSLLLRLEQQVPPEVIERDRQEISEGLEILLRELPSIRSVVVVDRAGRIQYASDASAVSLGFTSEENRSFFESAGVVRRAGTTEDGERRTELLVPVFDDPGPGATGQVRRRLGSLIVHYLPDRALTARLPNLRPPSIETRTFVLPVVSFLGVVALSGVLLALLMGLPVRRLDRALREFRARGFRGGLSLGGRPLRGEFASAVSAINEMGGRLEALDARGNERESLLATLGQSLEEGMIALDADDTPVAWNPAALRVVVPELQHAAADPQGPQQDRERAALVESLRRNPEMTSREGAGRHEVELLLGDETRVPVRITRVPFSWSPGRNGTLLLLRNLATLGEVEAHLLEAGRFAALAHLAAGLAHEIRNPLHAIGLNAGVVEQYVSRVPSKSGRQAVWESLGSIKDETRRLSDLLNSYLGLVREDSSSVPVDVHELCRRVRRLLAYLAAQANVEIRVEGDAIVPPVEGVAPRLQQAILNLVLNSIEAMPDGGVVTLETTLRDGVVELTVSDTGPGLPQGRVQELFGLRATTKPEGTGLGLPLARLIAEAHGGGIAYRARPGGGASMILRLPLRHAA